MSVNYDDEGDNGDDDDDYRVRFWWWYITSNSLTLRVLEANLKTGAEILLTLKL
jgi:hypothetical protein